MILLDVVGECPLHGLVVLDYFSRAGIEHSDFPGAFQRIPHHAVMIDKHAPHGARPRQRGVFDELRRRGIEFRHFAAPPIRDPNVVVLVHDHAVGEGVVGGQLVPGDFLGRAVPLGNFIRPRKRRPNILLGVDKGSIPMRRPLGFRIVRVILYRSGLAVDAHKTRVPGGPDVPAGVLRKAVPSKLRSRQRVVRPGGRARVHFADLQAPRVDVPNISILAEVRVVEAALAARERWNVVLDKHRLAQRFFIDGLIGNRQPALLAFRPEVLDQISDQLLSVAGSKRARHQSRTCIVKRVLHQINRRVPLRFVPLLVREEVRTVAQDAGPFNRLPGMTRRI